MIGIICALSQEINDILNLMKNKDEEIFSSLFFVTGTLNKIPCVAVLSGVGKVHAALCTQTLIIKYKPDFILNIGVAGGIDENVKIGDIVVARSIIQHDFDIPSFLCGKKHKFSNTEIPCSSWIVEKILDSTKNIKDTNIHNGTIVTGDQFINSTNKLLKLKNDFKGIACDMEAGGVAQTCFMNKVDFGVIKSISNNADSNAKTDFSEFTEKSSKNVASVLYNFLNHI